MNRATLCHFVEVHIASLGGSEFQDMCDRLLLKLYPEDYTPVRAGGSRGDMKNDGYCPEERVFFAAHATRGEDSSKTKEKIESDLEGCLQKHRDVARWVFLTNQTLLGEIEARVDELRMLHPGMTIETWGHKKIATMMLEFPERVVGDIIGIAIESTVEIGAEIDHAKSLLGEAKGAEARAVLERLWSQNNDKMSDRQRFLVQANIGHSYQAQAEWYEAARYFLRARQYDPTYERARALEALGYLLLGNRAKAESLSEALMADFPENTLGVAVHIRSIPREVPFDTVKGAVREHMLNDPEVALALSEAAIIRDLPEVAQSYAALVHNDREGNPIGKETLADALVMRARPQDRFVQERTATKEEIECLEKAWGLYTDLIGLHKAHGHSKHLSRLYIKRAEVSVALDREVEGEKDCLIAYELDPSNQEAVFKYAATKFKHGDLDAAIGLTEGLLQKRVRPIVELSLAQLLWRRGAEEDRSRCRDILMGRLNDLSGESPEFCVEYMSWLSDVERESNGLGAGLALLDGRGSQHLSAEVVLLLKAELLRLAGKLEEAVRMAREVQGLLSESTRPDAIRRTATLLQALGFHQDALRWWKLVVRNDCLGRDTLRAIECAQRCGDVQYILDLSSSLRANRIWDKRIFELELTYRAQYNDTATEVAILQNFVKQPLDASYLPQARLRLSVAGIRTGRNELIETDPQQLPLVTEVPPSIGRHVVEVLRRGPNPALAATYAYEMVRLNWDDPIAHSVMVHVFLPDGPVPSVSEPDQVVPGAAVFYREDDTGCEHWHIVEDSTLGVPRSTLHEYGPGSPPSQAMLGKKPGEQFYLIRDYVQERTATVNEVMSKYKYRFNASLKELETRFPDTRFVRRIVVGEKPDHFDFSPFERLAKKRAEAVQKLEEFYRDNLCPLHFLAQADGRSVVEAMQYIITETGLQVRCCVGSDDEQDEAGRSFRTAKAVVLDSTALATLLFTEAYPSMDRLPFALAVSEGTLNELRRMPFMRGSPESHGGSYSTKGWVATSPQDVLKARNAVEALVMFVEKNCRILAGTIVASIEADRREKLLKIFGDAGLEAMVWASQSENVLWTDDLATAVFAKQEFGCQRVWSQFIFEELAAKDVLARAISHGMVARLFAMRYYYVRPSVPVIMYAIEKSDGDVDQSPLHQVLDWFADEKAKKEGQFTIAGLTLKAIWQSDLLDIKAQSVTIRILERLGQRTGGTDIIHGLLQNLPRIFGLDVVNAEKVKETIEGWLRGGSRRIILP